MKISKEARRLARELFQASLVNGCLDTRRSAELADTVISGKPRGYLQILREYTRLIRLELARRHAIVESAIALEPAEVEKIRKDILARFGADITSEFRVNPKLLGGLRIQIGSDVWDGSVSNRLNNLSNSFNLAN